MSLEGHGISILLRSRRKHESSYTPASQICSESILNRMVSAQLPRSYGWVLELTQKSMRTL